jgi:hypothetical protein
MYILNNVLEFCCDCLVDSKLLQFAYRRRIFAHYFRFRRQTSSHFPALRYTSPIMMHSFHRGKCPTALHNRSLRQITIFIYSNTYILLSDAKVLSTICTSIGFSLRWFSSNFNYNLAL